MNFIDRFQTTLASSYTSGGGSLSLTSASGLPSGACDFFLVVKAEAGNTEEVFRVTNVSGTTLTVTGAQANTSASNHSSGATVEAGIITAAVLSAFGSSALVLLETQTASASSSLAFTSSISSSYDTYVLEMVDLVPINVSQTVLLEVSTNGGSSYDQTVGHYASNCFSVDLVNTSGAGYAVNMMNDTGNPVTKASGFCKFYGPGSSSAAKTFVGQMGSGQMGWNFWGIYNQTTAVNAFRIRITSSTITTGVARCYGVAK